MEANVIRFLEALEGQIRKPKADIKKEALQRFPGLSGREFDRLWAKYAPKRFTQSGRISSKETEV